MTILSQNDPKMVPKTALKRLKKMVQNGVLWFLLVWIKKKGKKSTSKTEIAKKN